MSEPIEATFENGVFRPLVPVALPEHERVQLNVVRRVPSEQSIDESPEVIAEQRRAQEELMAAMSKLPIEGPDDGFSGEDHDLILYGWKK